jgi:hypothetical protein
MGTNWLDTTYNVLNTADQFAAGFGDAVSFGATTKIRELRYGNLATRNHEGGWFTGGRAWNGASELFDNPQFDRSLINVFRALPSDNDIGAIGDLTRAGSGDWKERGTLYHYTDEKGLAGITSSNVLYPSTKAKTPNDARYGDGQYLSDIVPGTKTPAQLSRAFLGVPYQGRRFTHYVEIDIKDLNVVQGRTNVFVVPSQDPLDIVDRIIGSGSI